MVEDAMPAGSGRDDGTETGHPGVPDEAIEDVGTPGGELLDGPSSAGIEPPGDGEPYQSLYRRYRPQRFSEVRGQEHVTRALLNSVRDGRVAHAYLFSGPRGTGKTSTARILAMALNCEHPEDGEPCGTCDSCRGVRRGSSLDVHELDAASNRKLDEMRDLLSRVALGTSRRWKVYIVDEVHQLTSDAASALLKTLEEPPGHVIFVLATTDPQKVLPTIRSRTQHFEFHLLGADVLTGLLSEVNARASLGVPPEAIDLVVRRGHGSARDALSVLDQVAALGTVDDETAVVSDIVEGLADRDVGRILVAVAECTNAGRDPRRLAVDLLDHLRNGFLASQARGLVQLPDDAIAQVESQGRRLGLAALVRAMEVIGQASTDMRDSVDPRVTLEVALVRVASPAADHDPAALLARIERLEQRLASGIVSPGPEPTVQPSTVQPPTVQPPTAQPSAPLSAAPAAAGPPPPVPGPRSSPTPAAPEPASGGRPAPGRPARPGLGAPPPMPRPSLGARRRGPAEQAPGTGPGLVSQEAVRSDARGRPGSPARPPEDAAGTAPYPATGAPPAEPALEVASPGPTASVGSGTGVAGPEPEMVAGTAPSAGGMTAGATGEPATSEAAEAGSSSLPSRDELTKAWGDLLLPSSPGRLKAYLALGRFVSVEPGAVVFALPDNGLLSRAETVRRDFEAALGAHFGRPVPVRLALDQAAPLVGSSPAAALVTPGEVDDDEPGDYVLADLEDVGSGVVSPEQRLLEAFPGAEEVTP